ncbi:MAG: hypothetical protein JWP41_1880 [Ramlibacter sp.]|nr:hypothetical protein [Ramlibacter sp.]
MSRAHAFFDLLLTAAQLLELCMELLARVQWFG